MEPSSDLTRSAVHQEQIIVCECCNTVNIVPALEPGQRVRCERCQHVLLSYHPQLVSRLQAFSIAALIMLVMVFSFPLLGVSSNGIERQMSLIDTLTVLLGQHFIAFGILVVLLLFVFPISYLLALSYLAFGWKFQRRLMGRHLLAYWCTVCHPWLMVDVFLVGLLVSLVKLHSLAHIQLGLSFWAYSLFVLLYVRVVSLIDKRVLWQLNVPDFQLMTAKTLDPSAKNCSFCGAAVAGKHLHCSRCHHRVTRTRRYSVRITLALLAAAVIMYIPANVLPIMMTEFLGQKTYSTILGGVLLLWSLKSYPVAMVIFIASVVVPLAKIFSLGWLCWQVKRPNHQCLNRHKQCLYHITEFVGRWSMIDIFVVAILTALVQMGNLMRVVPGPAVLSFAGVVVLTMLAARCFDPRLLWQESEPESSSQSHEELSF
ncbi:PqiA/YebS family transporter subunit [Celerinatantimonas sp. YJH-8]|uniref:PqiA/YebS family transporter subunit n=1 Tax=Celerinatantimonas sp. YJH-8 TaxID=3228714 RepID=UPI0038C063E1